MSMLKKGHVHMPFLNRPGHHPEEWITWAKWGPTATCTTPNQKKKSQQFVIFKMSLGLSHSIETKKSSLSCISLQGKERLSLYNVTFVCHS